MSLEALEEVRQIRKLQLSGGSTFIISIPKTWIDDLKLKVGDSVVLIKNSNNSVSIISAKETERDPKTKAVITISQQDSNESIRRKIIATYLGGYKTIQIKSKGMRIFPEHARTIRDLVRSSMIGTEIVESSSEKISIQILTRLPELSFTTALKRMYLMTVNMHKEAIEALVESDTSHADDIVQMDDEVDRFSLYMRRNLGIAVQNANVLREMGLKKPSDCLGYRTVISRIERIADHASLIAKRIKFIDGKIDPKMLKKIAQVDEEALKVFEEAVTALEQKNYKKAEQVADYVKEVIKIEKEIMKGVKDNTKNSTVIKFVLEDIRRTVDYSNDISEVAIDENIHHIISEKE